MVIAVRMLTGCVNANIGLTYMHLRDSCKPMLIALISCLYKIMQAAWGGCMEHVYTSCIHPAHEAGSTCSFRLTFHLRPCQSAEDEG